jgi:C4-dicarboxylate transporter/malic acid transport protein
MTIKQIFSEGLKNVASTVRQLTPNWFVMTMGMGVIALILEVFPFQFRGLHTISIVIYVTNVVIFCMLTLLLTARYIMSPCMFNVVMKSPQQSMYIGAIPMGLSTIINYTILVVVKDYEWGMNLAFILWCVELFLTLFSLVVVPFYMFVHHSHKLESVSGAWILPIAPGIFTAASGGLLANNIDDVQKAVVIIVISYMLMGVGLSLALTITVIFFYRLAIHKLPPKEMINTTFIPLGALGQSAYGIIQIGSACQKVIGDDYIKGLGSTAYNMSFIIALMLWGYGFWYLIIGILFVATSIKIPFNMSWWALIFPLGSLTVATVAIGNIMDSMVFRVIASIFTVRLVIACIIVSAKTSLGVWFGTLSPPVKVERDLETQTQ